MDVAAFVIAIFAVIIAVGALWASWLNRRDFTRYVAKHAPLEKQVGLLLSERSGAEMTKSGVISLIVNPVKANAKEAEKLVREFAGKAGYTEVLVLETTEEDPGKQMALDALAAKSDAVFAAGGDGTVRMVAEELAGTGIPLGILPLGTGNLLARNLEFNVDDLRGHCTGLFKGWVRKVDTMMLTMTMADGSTETRRSLVIAGVGADAMMMQDTKEEVKALYVWLAYGEAGRTQRMGRRQRVSSSLEGHPRDIRKVRSVMFANVGQLQAGVNFVPDAVIDDGLLDIVVLSPRGGIGWLSIARQTVTGKVFSRDREAIEFLQGSRVKLSVLDGDTMPCQLDGDVIGEITDITAQVDPGSLHLLVPHTK